MLKRKFRLNAKTKLQQPLVSHSPFFTLRYSANNLSYCRYGFVVSKKVDKRATARNRMKRKLRSCIEANLEKITGGYDMIFFIKIKVLDDPTSNLCDQVESVLRQRKLLV